MLKEKEVIEVSEGIRTELSEGQLSRWEQLKGLKFLVGKVKKGAKLQCCICGHRSTVERSTFAEVTELASKRKGLLSAGCCETYFDRVIVGSNGSRSKGYKIYI